MGNADISQATSGSHIDEATGVETVGHEWDGIEELNNPLPRWWLWSFYASIIFAVAYMVVYPAWPLLDKGTEGLWGWSSRGQLAEETRRAESARGDTLAAIAATPITALQGKPELMRAAISGGRAAFKVNCVQCHGAGASGSKGYPNLADDDWLWGGDIAAIEMTLIHGVRQPGDDATRVSMMPAYGRDALLTPAQVEDVASHVRTLAGKEKASSASGRGTTIFAEQCAVCHGPDGKGLRQFGAPDLTDAIWLYGGSRAEIVQQINVPAHGVMPSWGSRLDPVTVKMLAAYVHSLGGGEDFAAGPDLAGGEASTAVSPVTPAGAGNEQP